MPRQAATIESLPMAFETVKAMRADGHGKKGIASGPWFGAK